MKEKAVTETLLRSVLKLDRWVENAEWKAYDTFDGLASPYAGILTLDRPLLKQFWQQGVRRFPINLRPLLGIKPATSSKGMGFFAQGYLRLYLTYGKEEYLRKMRSCLAWLIKNRSPGFKGYCWGNHFDYQSRGGRIPRGVPTVVWTSLIGHAFLDAYEALGEKEFLEVGNSIAEFILNELGWIDTGQDICISYTPLPGGKPVKGTGGIQFQRPWGGVSRAPEHPQSGPAPPGTRRAGGPVYHSGPIEERGLELRLGTQVCLGGLLSHRLRA